MTAAASKTTSFTEMSVNFRKKNAPAAVKIGGKLKSKDAKDLSLLLKMTAQKITIKIKQDAALI